MTQKFPDKGLRTALFAGSFDPFTIGHASVVERALPLFEHFIIAVGTNAAKHGSSAVADRVKAICELYSHDPRVEVISYEGKLTVDLAAELGAHWLVRGVRSVKDFEYERDLADINRRLGGVETLLLYSLPEHGAISSSVVRELSSYGRDISSLIPHN